MMYQIKIEGRCYQVQLTPGDSGNPACSRFCWRATRMKSGAKQRRWALLFAWVTGATALKLLIRVRPEPAVPWRAMDRRK